MAAAELWYAKGSGQPICRTDLDRRDHATATALRRVGLLDGGLHGSDPQRPGTFSLAADFSPTLGSVTFAPRVRLHEKDLKRLLGSSLRKLKSSQLLLWSCIYASDLPWTR